MNDILGMKSTRSIAMPLELYERLEAGAKAMGLSVPAYIAFLEECKRTGHDGAFQDAARQVFADYPKTLRKLAE